MTSSQKISNADALYIDTSILIKVDAKPNEDGGQVARFLIYGCSIPMYCSLIGFGEFIGVIGKPRVQKRIGAEGYLFCCRQLMIDFEMKKLRHFEPPSDKREFYSLANSILKKHNNLGGGDIWHLLSAITLKKQYESVILASFDKNLVAAARTEGINAVNGLDLTVEELEVDLKKSGKWIGQ